MQATCMIKYKPDSIASSQPETAGVKVISTMFHPA